MGPPRASITPEHPSGLRGNKVGEIETVPCGELTPWRQHEVDMMCWGVNTGMGAGSWFPIWVLLCDSGQVTLPLWALLLQMDKIISEVTEDCDYMHLP